MLVLLLHAEDDQIVPIENSAHKAIKLLKNGKTAFGRQLYAHHLRRRGELRLRLEADVAGLMDGGYKTSLAAGHSEDRPNVT